MSNTKAPQNAWEVGDYVTRWDLNGLAIFKIVNLFKGTYYDVQVEKIWTDPKIDLDWRFNNYRPTDLVRPNNEMMVIALASTENEIDWADRAILCRRCNKRNGGTFRVTESGSFEHVRCDPPLRTRRISDDDSEGYD